MDNLIQSILEQSGIDRDTFFKKFFEKEPCLLHCNEFNNIVDISKFEQILWESENRFRTDLRINYHGTPTLVPNRLTGKDLYRWVIDQYHDGKTIILNGIEKTDFNWAKIARQFDIYFGGLSSVNAFLTPAESQGFKPHFDSHDVFIIQLSGSKHWGLYNIELSHPLPQEIYLIDNSYERVPSKEYVLTPGDILYIPKGYIHSGKAQEEYSLHYTLGIRPIKQIDILHELIDCIAIENPDLKMSNFFEIAFNLSDKSLEIIKDNLSSTYFKLKAAQKAEMKFITSLRPLPNRSLELETDKINFAVDLFTSSEGAVANILEKTDCFCLFFPGIGITGSDNLQPGSLSFPYNAYGYVKWIIKNQCKNFSLNDGPNYIDEDSKKNIIKSLIKNGYLELVQ